MNLTAQLKAWLIENCGVAEGASDEDFRKAAATAVFVTPDGDAGHLSQDKLSELTADKAAEGAGKLTQILGDLAKGQKAINERLDAIDKGGGDADQLAAAAKATREAIAAMIEGTPPLDSDDLQAAADAKKVAEEKAEEEKAAKEAKDIEHRYDKANSAQLGSKLYAGGDGAYTAVEGHRPNVTMKWAHTQYDDTHKGAHFSERLANGQKSAIGGRVITDIGLGAGGRPLNHPSELDKAVSGAYAKFRIHSQLAHRCPSRLRMTAHDEQLMSYAMHELKWGGVIGGICAGDPHTIEVDNRKLTGLDRKALLDESGGSEGLEIAPIVFDDAIIMYAFLLGELFPLVNVVNLTRGRRVEGAVLAELTLQSGHVEGSAMNLFNTASFVTAFDTPIFAVSGGFEIGLDFITDTPVDIGGIIVEEYGKALLKYLDTQIATGDGTTEPEGVMNASGITAVAFGGVTPTVAAYESILFTVEKRFKSADTRARTVFCSNELSYSRARGIAVGTSDARRVFGMDEESYEVFGHGYKITESMTNTQLFFGNLARYRLYRRQGMTFRVSTEGETLIRKNTMLITLRARYGGQIEDSGAYAASTTLLA